MKFKLGMPVALLGLVLVCFANSAAAQLQHVVGTGTSSSASMAPVYRSSAGSSFDYSRYVILYNSSDLSGLPSGATITDLEFFLVSGDTVTGASANFNMYLRNTTATNYSASFSWDTTGATLVYSNAAQTVSGSNSFFSFGAFSTPFNYTGDGIEVLVEWDISAFGSDPTVSGFTWQYTPRTGSSSDSQIGGAGGSSMPTTMSVTSSANYGRLPNARFNYSVGNSTALSLAGTTGAQNIPPAPLTTAVVLDLSADTFQSNNDLSSITFTKTGTVADAEFSNVTLYRDNNSDGIVDAGDTVLGGGPGSLTGGSVTFSGSPLQALVVGTPVRLLLATDVSSAPAVGDSFSFSATAATWTGGTDLTGYPVSGGSFDYVSSLGLTTTFAGGNGLTTGGNMFDLTTNASSILITEFDCHVDATGAGVDWEIYYRVGTYVGNQGIPANWILHDSVTSTGAGVNNPTKVTLNNPLVIPAASTYALYITLTTPSGINYTNGSGTYSDAYISVQMGDGVDYPFGGVNTGREWNGTIHYVPDPDGVLLGLNGSTGGAVTTALTDHVVMDISANAFTTPRDINSITFDQTGSAADTAFTSVDLVRDDNDNGIVDGTDMVLGTGTLSGGSITFSAAPLPQAVTTASPVRLLLAVDATGLALGDSIQFEVNSASDVNWSGGTDYTGYPLQGAYWIVSGPAVSFPYTLGFETPEPYYNGTFDTAPTSVPTVITVGGAPGADALTSTLNGYSITSGPIGTGNTVPHSGSFMLDMFGGSSAGAVALDLEFDMSTFSLTEYVELDFWWADEGIDSSTTTNDRLGVFISTNGGTTWELAAYQFDPLGPEGVWNRVTLSLSPMLSALSLNYTNQMVIRFQYSESSTADHLLLDDITVDRPAPQLRVGAALANVNAVFAGQTNQVVGEATSFSINSTQSLDSITFTQNGTANSADLSNLKLWEDTNNDGVFSAGDTQLGTTVASMTGSTVTFTASPLRTYTLNEQSRLFVTADIAALPSTPAVIQLSVANAADITATPGFSGGSYPVDLSGVAIKVPVSTFPYVQDFETAIPYDNALFTTNGASVPTVAVVGLPAGAPTSYSAAGGFVISASTAGSAPNTGAGMLELSGSSGNAYVAMDLYFDMSAFDVANDTFDLEFFWNDEGIDNGGDTNETLGVFISNDGGATWGLALYQFPHSLNTGVWNQVNVPLSAMMSAVGMNFSSQVVMRFQYAEDSTVDYLLIDDITLSQATTAELRVTTGPAKLPMAAVPGDTDVVMGSFRFDAVASSQNISGVNVSLGGSLAETELTNVRLFEDTNSDNMFNTGDTQLGTSGVFSGGSLFFAATSLTTINGSAPTLFVVADLAGTAPAGDTFSVSIDGGVLAINTTPGPVNAAASVSGGSATAVVQLASTPALQDFETLPPYADALLTNTNVMPTVTSVGGVPGIGTADSIGFGNVTAGPVNGSSPFAGTQMLDLSGATGSGGAAINLFYDLSGFTTSDVVQLQFAWNDEGIDADTTTIFNERFMGVFLSTDAGSTWEAVVFQFDPSGTEGIWNQETINLSTIMAGLSLGYTDRMVLRFQMSDSSTTESLLLDDISVQVAQEIDVQRNSTSIPNAGFEVVGPIPVNTNQSFTLDILNDAPIGANDLNLTGSPVVQVGATTNASVNVTAQPTQTTLTAGSSESFDVDITPVAGGAYVVELIIPNDDPDEAPYIVTLVGTGVEPEIDVQRPAGTSIADGSTDSYGAIAAGVSNSFTYFIVNGGNATLNLTGSPAVDIQNVVNAAVSVSAQPGNTALAPAAVAPFDLEVTPNLGAFSFEIVITNNDANEGNYTITVTGTGATTPEIDIKDSLGGDVLEGGVYTLGNIAPGNTETQTFTIENNGNADLLLTGSPTIEILAPTNVTVSVSATPAATIAISGSDVFTLDITPASTGSFSFQVRIQNNDANEGSYTFTISGFASNPVGGGSGGGDDGGGCSTSDTDLGLWSLLLGALALMAVVTRVRASRD